MALEAVKGERTVSEREAEHAHTYRTETRY